jgi:hypothetical protein
MRNQFLSIIIVFLMGYFSNNFVSNIRPVAFSMYNTIEALVVSNNHSVKKDIAKNNNTKINLVNDHNVGLLAKSINIIIAKENKKVKSNPFSTREGVIPISCECQSFSVAKIRGPTPIGNNTS